MDTTTWNLRLKAIGTSFNHVTKLSPNALGQELFDIVVSQGAFPAGSFKLMCSGRYIKSGDTLEANKLKDGASILVMKASQAEGGSPSTSAVSTPTTTTVDIVAEKKAEEERVEKVLEAAEALSRRKGEEEDVEGGGGGYYLEMTDQNGRPFSIGGEDRHALLMGLALHEKARKWMEKEEWEKAIEYLLASDKAFNRCSPGIINAVDNPGFLSLDIAWCYFMTQKIEFLKDASWRLEKASQFFDQSYGPLQERLITLKGGACPEMVVYVRLYLLEAIVSFHNGNKERAANFLIMCEQKLNEMMLSPKDLQVLEELGFTSREARIALRAANKNVTAAVEYAMAAREAQKERRAAERQRRLERSMARTFGRCADGGFIDVGLLDSMTEMGFERGLVAEALKQANNVQHVALGLLTDHSHLLRDVASNAFKPTEEMVNMVMGFGFLAEESRKALRLMMGDTEKAVNFLLYKSGVDVEGAEEFAQIEAQVEMVQDEAGGYSDDEPAGDDAAADAADSDDLEGDDGEDLIDAKAEELRKAEYDLVGDINTDEPEAHLDLTLEIEAKFLAQYKGYLV